LKSIGKYLSDINFVNKNEIISKIELNINLIKYNLKMLNILNKWYNFNFKSKFKYFISLSKTSLIKRMSSFTYDNKSNKQ